MSSPRLYRLRAAFVSQGAATEITLQLPTVAQSATSAWLIVSFHFVRTAGTGANWAPALGEASGFTLDGIDERFGYSAGTASINDIFAQPIPCKTDANGRLYLKPTFNTGADNAGNYEIWFIKAKGG